MRLMNAHEEVKIILGVKHISIRIATALTLQWTVLTVGVFITTSSICVICSSSASFHEMFMRVKMH
jgi:hypothetical protein